MKRLIILLLMLPVLGWGAKKYISPTGSDGNAGTYASPYLHLDKAWSQVTTNDTIYCLPGTYLFTSQQDCRDKNGIKVLPYSTRPVFSRAAGGYWAAGQAWNNGAAKSLLFFWNCDNLTLKNFDVTGFTQDTVGVCSGIKIVDINNMVMEGVRVYGCGQGMNIVGSWTSLNDTSTTCLNNLIKNCDFYNNEDSLNNYGNASGLSIGVMSSSSTTYIKGCRFFWNTDNGMDSWNNEGYIEMSNCWSFFNGYLPETFTPCAGNGVAFKLGQTLATHTAHNRVVYNCVAYKNTLIAYDQNNMKMPVTLYNNTSISNGSWGYNFYDNDYLNIAKNNISYNDLHRGHFGASSTLANNTFIADGATNSSYTVTWADFASADSTQLVGSRVNGELPNITFLHLVTGSDLKDSGTYVGLPYQSTAPDLGPFEFDTPKDATVNKGFLKSAGKILKSAGKFVKR